VKGCGPPQHMQVVCCAEAVGCPRLYEGGKRPEPPLPRPGLELCWKLFLLLFLLSCPL
jgi:hypothetical protein